MKDEKIYLNPEDCSNPNAIGLNELILQGIKKLPNAQSWKYYEIRVPIQKPIELDPYIIELNLELMHTNIPIDPMSSYWTLIFRKSICRTKWEFVRLED